MLRIEILDRGALVIPIRLGVDGVAGQHDGPGPGQFDEQTLVAWRMPRRSDEPDAAIPKHIMIALGLADRLTRREAGSTGRIGPIIFGLLHEQCCLWKEFHISDVIAVRM